MQHVPFFKDQSDSTQFIRNYGLLPWNKGDYIQKPMYECTGEEILREMLYQLGLSDEMDGIVLIVRYAHASCLIFRFNLCLAQQVIVL